MPDLWEWTEYKQGAELAKRAIAQPSQYDRIFDSLFPAVTTYVDLVKQYVKVGGFFEEYTTKGSDLGRLTSYSASDIKRDLKSSRQLKDIMRRE